MFHIAATRIPYEFVRSQRTGENTASPAFHSSTRPGDSVPLSRSGARLPRLHRQADSRFSARCSARPSASLGHVDEQRTFGQPRCHDHHADEDSSRVAPQVPALAVRESGSPALQQAVVRTTKDPDQRKKGDDPGLKPSSIAVYAALKGCSSIVMYGTAVGSTVVDARLHIHTRRYRSGAYRPAQATVRPQGRSVGWRCDSFAGSE